MYIDEVAQAENWARDIAAVMLGCKVQPNSRRMLVTYFSHPSGAQIGVRWDNGRLAISLTYEPMREGEPDIGHEYRDITVSTGKTPEQIARDIDRRLIAPFLEVKPLWDNRAQNARAGYLRQQEIIAELTASGVYTRDHRNKPGGEAHFSDTDAWIDGRVSSDGTKMWLDTYGMPVDLGMAIIRMMRTYAAEHPDQK